MITHITKRNGDIVKFDANKLIRWSKWAAVVGADWFGVVGDAYAKCPENCTTQELQKALIAACLDREDEPHSLMAGRLLMGEVYKQAFGNYDKIPSVKTMYHNMVEAGLWDDMKYTDEELDQLESVVNHKQELRSMHSVINQIVTKYAITDVESGRIIETPAFVWLRMAMGICQDEPAETKIQQVKAYYNDFLLGKINAPTPNIRNLGTPKRNYASCCVFKSGDTLDSLAAGDHIAYKMSAASAGIGSYIETRSKGDGIRKNTLKHSGKLNYLRSQESAVNANMQGARGGAETTHILCIDPEIEMLVKLRHPTTVPKYQIKGLDYSFVYHPYLVEKAAKNEKWMLVSIVNAPELYKAIYSADVSTFKKLYDEYESGKGKRKYIPARKLVNSLFLTTQEETGRLYELNIHEVNRHTPFKDTIHSSNLC